MALVQSEADAQARFGANIKRLREKAGMSQETLADRAGLHRTEVSLLERSGREPRLWTILRLSRALGVTPAQLLNGIR